MSVYSKILSLINGANRTVDFSVPGNSLGLSSLEFLGSTSGNVQVSASAVTSSYSLVLPSAQGGISSFLQNDGSGNLSWGTVTSSPAISNIFTAGQSIAANTSFIVRWGMNVLSETTDRIYKADYSTVSFDEFWAIGIAFSSTSVLAGQPVSVYSFGAYTLGSSDTPFNSSDVGSPVWLTSSGAFSTTAPTGTSEADLKIGIVMSTTQIWIDGQMMGIGSSTGGGPNPLPVSDGGTGNTSFSPYAIIAGGTSSTGALQQVSGLGTSGYVLTSNGTGALPSWQASTGGVSSVAFADASTTPIYSISGSPVTSSGTLTQTLTTQTANTVFSGPTAGGAAQPSFRSLVSADIPSLSSIYLPLAGGTMSGNIAMGSHKLTGLSASSTAGDSVRYEQAILASGVNAWSANQDLGGFLITGSGTPVNPNDLTSKSYVDGLVNGASWKTAVLVATTASITLSGEQTIDGFTTSSSRVLVKNQSTNSQNGIYVSASGAWSRAADMNSWSEVPAAAVFVQEGTVNADLGFICTAQPGGTLGSTAITWVQFSSAGAYSADGTTLQLVSGVFSIKNGGVANTQVSATAAIDFSKLAALTSAHILVGNGSAVATDVAVSGDLTLANTGAFTVAKIQTTVVSGTTGSGNVVFSASPTFTGTITAAAANFSGAISASNFSGSSSGTNTGDISLTAVGSSPSANGASLSGQALTLQPADATHPGLVTTAAQTMAGAKNFSTSVSSAAFISNTANAATAGIVQLASADAIDWRNNANSANIALAKNTSDQLTYAGTAVLSSAGVLLATAFPALTGDVTTSAGSLTTTVAKIAGTTVSGTIGTGNVVFSISPTFTGTVSAAAINASGTVNLSGLSISLPVQTDASKNLVSAAIDLSGTQATGILAAARHPALTGDVTTSSGAIATTIAANAVTNAKAAQMATLTIKGNNTGGTANALDLTVAQVLTMLGQFSGKTAISSASTSQAVTFSTAYAGTSYTITANLLNVTDTNPQFQPITITAQATTGFTAKWNMPTDTANYILSWQASLSN